MIWKGLIAGLSLVLLMLVLLVNSDWFWELLAPTFYEDVLAKYSEEYKIDPLLSAAIIKVESSFYSGARSPRGALGLMQIMPATAKEIAIELKMRPFTTSDLYDPEINIRIGLYYLARLKKEFNDDLPLVLAAYNGGQGNVKKWLKGNKAGYEVKNIPFPETRNFVQAVLWNYQWAKNVQRARKLLQLRKHKYDFS